ncbi:F-box protein-like protein isoform X1 [Tanacetum coccineum]
METIARYLSELFIRPEVDTTAVDDRASKEHITDNDNGGNELPFSVLTVMSNDDLLTEILLRLPVISLVLFKSVSKHWLSLIKDTTFMKRRSQIPNIDPPSGVFFAHPGFNYQYGFRRLDIRIPVSSFLFKNAFKFGSKEEVGSNALVKQSCNGLLLCYVSPDHKYYVYNPTVKMFNMIPQPCKSNVNPRFRCHMIMGFDPTKSPHYKVVYATSIGDNDDDDDDDVVVSIQIQTYSSETRSWSAVSSDPLSGRCFSCFEYGIYWNDAIHWLSGMWAFFRHLKDRLLCNKTVVLQRYQLL